MKLWVALVAAALVAGCGAEAPPTTSPPPTPPSRSLWGLLGGLGGGNVTRRLQGPPLFQRLRWLVTELGSQARWLGASLQAEVAEAGERAADYGAEAKAALEQGWGELRNRGATWARKMRKRLGRDGEELRRRWDAYGQALEEKMAALRRGWGAGEGLWEQPPALQANEV